MSKGFSVLIALWLAQGVYIAAASADDVQVNTYTTDGQKLPSVSLDDDGDFVVVWQSSGSAGTDSSTDSIQAQLYASDGSTTGVEFQVNIWTTDAQRRPAVALDTDGDFVVVWESLGSAGSDSSSFSIQGQRYASDGSAAGDEIQVNTTTTDAQRLPAVAMDDDGDFVVVWDSQSSSGSDSSSYSVQGQRYASDGSAVATEFQINTYTTGAQRLPAVAMDGNGDFVVVWQSPGSAGTDASSYSIQGQRYASDGSAVAAEFQINTYTTSAQAFPAVAMSADGHFAVVWQSFGSTGTDTDSGSIQGQRYASDGSAAGGEFQVNTFTTNTQDAPAVAMDAGGNVVVVWHSLGSAGTDSSTFSVHRQRYTANGSALGGELQVNTYTTDAQRYPSVGASADGLFVVAWQSLGSAGTDTSVYSVQQTSGEIVLFTDGCESGDTTAW
ncbi:MAG: hypothetical protein GY719_42825 [bacterium]|nr:hypothetical protein [bacterium]